MRLGVYIIATIFMETEPSHQPCHVATCRLQAFRPSTFLLSSRPLQTLCRILIHNLPPLLSCLRQDRIWLLPLQRLQTFQTRVLFLLPPLLYQLILIIFQQPSTYATTNQTKNLVSRLWVCFNLASLINARRAMPPLLLLRMGKPSGQLQ